MLAWAKHTIVLLTTWTMFACGAEGSACRSSDDCSGKLGCDGPSEPQACGIGPNQQCGTDQDCFGMYCHAVFDACSDNGFGAECRPACTEQSCGEGMRCNAAGACEGIPCDDGWTCPPYQACDVVLAHEGPMYARGHGCVAIPCSNDDACPSETVCVNGMCQEGPGTCVEPMLVP